MPRESGRARRRREVTVHLRHDDEPTRMPMSQEQTASLVGAIDAKNQVGEQQQHSTRSRVIFGRHLGRHPTVNLGVNPPTYPYDPHNCTICLPSLNPSHQPTSLTIRDPTNSSTVFTS